MLEGANELLHVKRAENEPNVGCNCRYLRDVYVAVRADQYRPYSWDRYRPSGGVIVGAMVAVTNAHTGVARSW